MLYYEKYEGNRVLSEKFEFIGVYYYNVTTSTPMNPNYDVATYFTVPQFPPVE